MEKILALEVVSSLDVLGFCLINKYNSIYSENE